MKHIYIILLAALTFAACSKDKEDHAAPAQPPASVNHAVRYLVKSYMPFKFSYRQANGLMSDPGTFLDSASIELTFPTGAQATLLVTDYTTVLACIIVDGDTVRRNTGGGPIYLDYVIP